MPRHFLNLDTSMCRYAAATEFDVGVTRSFAWWMIPESTAIETQVFQCDARYRVSFRYDVVDTWTYVQRGTTDGVWSIPAATIPLGRLTHVAITYDVGSTANDPLWYVDGQPIAVTRNTAPVAPDTTVQAFALGARAFFPSMLMTLGEFSAFDRILTFGEVRYLAQRSRPSAKPLGPKFYYPVTGQGALESDYGRLGTVPLTPAVTEPRVWVPVVKRRRVGRSAAQVVALPYQPWGQRAPILAH